MARGGAKVKAALEVRPIAGHTAGMPPDNSAKAPTREQRLAAKLRENLHRRKAQARAGDVAPEPSILPETCPKN